MTEGGEGAEGRVTIAPRFTQPYSGRARWPLPGARRRHLQLARRRDAMPTGLSSAMIPDRNQLCCGCFALIALLGGDWAAWPIMNASGQVRDAAGRALPRARVTVQSVDRERRYGTTTTDDEGRFAMALGGIDVREVELLVEADRF
ncbi:MAG TPA: carboxypeptidase-like regulatory domain-containing protein, partial [Thermoanaerobaculia bacterium]|nr:carboxypeptidase-like regulatory domain-containing protein [Thermoanaerobaculia bacterium]